MRCDGDFAICMHALAAHRLLQCNEWKEFVFISHRNLWFSDSPACCIAFVIFLITLVFFFCHLCCWWWCFCAVALDTITTTISALGMLASVALNSLTVSSQNSKISWTRATIPLNMHCSLAVMFELFFWCAEHTVPAFLPEVNKRLSRQLNKILLGTAAETVRKRELVQKSAKISISNFPSFIAFWLWYVMMHTHIHSLCLTQLIVSFVCVAWIVKNLLERSTLQESLAEKWTEKKMLQVFLSVQVFERSEKK